MFLSQDDMPMPTIAGRLHNSFGMYHVISIKTNPNDTNRCEPGRHQASWQRELMSSMHAWHYISNRIPQSDGPSNLHAYHVDMQCNNSHHFLGLHQSPLALFTWRRSFTSPKLELYAINIACTWDRYLPMQVLIKSASQLSIPFHHW